MWVRVPYLRLYFNKKGSVPCIIDTGPESPRILIKEAQFSAPGVTVYTYKPTSSDYTVFFVLFLDVEVKIEQDVCYIR